jgi:metallophosphoesterase (TIGR00282 family)
LREKTKIIIVDFHAEATAEKVAMGWFLDGEVSAVIGTHTHIQTADERILPKGTAYITDAGMCGALDSVLGMKVETSIKRILTGISYRLEPATTNLKICGVFLTIDEDTGKATGIKRIKEPNE